MKIMEEEITVLDNLFANVDQTTIIEVERLST